MSMLSQLTCVIPSYRNPDRVGRAIESVLEQSGVDTRVIVVIDDQCRATERLAASLGERVETIWNETNRGAPYSRNAGLARAKTPFVMFLDSDDWIEGELLAGLCKAIESQSAQIGFGPWRRYLDETGTYSPIRPGPTGFSTETLFSQWLQGKYFVPCCSVLWRTDALKEIGGWDEQLARNQDGELVMRGLLKGLRFAVSDEGAGIYVTHEGEHRVSKQQQNYSALVEVVDSLLALESDRVKPEAVNSSAARAYYEIARRAFLAGDPVLGRTALAQARGLRFFGHSGSVPARIIGRFLGLENRIRIGKLFP